MQYKCKDWEILISWSKNAKNPEAQLACDIKDAGSNPCAGHICAYMQNV